MRHKMAISEKTKVRRRQAAAGALVAAAAAVLCFCGYPVLSATHHAVMHSRHRISADLMSQGIVFLADLNPENPRDPVSGRPIRVKGAQRVAVPGGWGRRIKAGGTSYVSPYSTLLSATEATYALSISAEGVGRRQELVNQSSGESGMILSLENGELAAEFRNLKDTMRLSAPFNGAPGRFTTIAVSISTNSAVLFQNGRESVRAELPWSVSLLPRPWLFSNDSRYPFLGTVAAAAIWRRPLSSAELARISGVRSLKLRSMAPLAFSYAAAADSVDGIARGAYRIFDRLTRLGSGTAAMKPSCPVLTLRMKKGDERHFMLTHEKSLAYGYRTGGAEHLRSIGLVLQGVKFPAEACLDDSYSTGEPVKRPAFIVACTNDAIFGQNGVARLYPPELHAAFHFDAPDVFPANGRFVRLYEDSSFRGIYIVEPLDTPGSAWMERGAYDERRLYANAAPKLPDIPPPGVPGDEARDAADRLILSDSLFPWSAPELKVRRKVLARRRKRSAIRDFENPVLPVWSILGGNRAPMFITQDLDLSSAPGLTWQSSAPDVIGNDGRVTRPSGNAPRAVELVAVRAGTGESQRYRLRVMPEKPGIPAIFIGIGSPLEKARRGDFVFTLVREGEAPPVSMRGLVGENGGIRHRGNSSYVSGVKRSLALAFGEPLAWPDAGHPSKRLLLHNGYTDPTRLRNRLAFEFFHDAALAGGDDQPAPRFAWAEVFVNGEYFGVWEASGRIRDLVPQDWQVFKVRGMNSWLWGRNDTSILDCITAMPGDETPYRQLEDVFTFLVNAPEEEFVRDSGRYFDMDNLIACYLLLNFTDNRDAVHMNQYIAFSPESKRVVVIPWDYDKIFLKRRTTLLANHLFNRYIREAPGFVGKATERWKALREGPYSDQMVAARIDGYAALLAPYMEEEWRLLQPAGFDGDFPEAIADLKNVVLKQLSLMDRAFWKMQGR